MNTSIILTENIPSDLAKAYKRFWSEGTVAKTHKHQDINHGDLGHENRRNILVDYGKASYRAISRDEARQLIKADKNNIHNMRFIIDDELVEMEIRPTGSYYPIFRESGTKWLTYTTRTGRESEIKLGDVTTVEPIIQNASKIYITDEYDHILSYEQQKEREEKKKSNLIYSMDKNNREEYGDLLHMPFQNRATRVKTYPNVLDTGNHTPWIQSNYHTDYKEGQFSLTDEEMADKDYSDYIKNWHNYSTTSNYRVYDTYKSYWKALRVKKQKYKEYDSARRSLIDMQKKLEKSPDSVDLQQKVAEMKKDVSRAYDANQEAALNLRKEKDKLLKNIDNETIQNNMILYKVAAKIEMLLKRSHELEIVYEEKKNSDVISANWNSRNELAHIRTHIQSLKAAKEELASLQARGRRDAEKEQDITNKMNNLKTSYDFFKTYNAKFLDGYEADIVALEQRSIEANNRRKVLKRFGNTDKQQDNKKELDSTLKDLIIFED